jgi:UMF1 family MFS transporter
MAVVGEKIGFKKSLIASILMMIAVVIGMIFTKTIEGFFLIGVLAGFALTGVQSVSRTMVGLFAPKGQSAEFFGFFSVAVRTSSFIGPTIYGILAAEAAIWFEKQGNDPLSAEQTGQRIAIFSIALFLIAGLVILLAVNERKAKAAAEGIEID